MRDPVAIDWYFDFISPFAYLQFYALEHHLSQRPDLKIHFKPVLFAALLKHNSHKGPAEIPSKRLATYRYCQWYANLIQLVNFYHHTTVKPTSLNRLMGF